MPPESLSRLRGTMVSFARRRLRDLAAAEDAASEALLALLESPGAFRGESQLQTYAIGVLKHKIVDAIRAGARESASEPDLLDGPDLREGADDADDRGWAAAPDLRLERTQQQEAFWRTLRGALHGLPQRLRTVFWMRDVGEWDTPAICRHLGITEGHAHVLVHRARRQVRERWEAAAA